MTTFDVVFSATFDNQVESSTLGSRSSIKACKAYIDRNNGSRIGFFNIFKKGTASIVCNETNELIHTEKIK
jgi:hypothetical protein